jgi:hypothetical protein
MFNKPLPRNLSALVEEQISKWKAERGEAGDESPAPLPLISISRESGSLGAAVGRQAAKILGFDFWDQELVHAIAEETGAQEALLMSLDERSRNRIEDFIAETILGASGSALGYVRQVIRVVHSIERHGGAVVIGRGSQFILPEDSALRVRVVCPHEKRVSGYAERENLSRQEAEQQVRHVERERQAFHRRYYQQEVGEPTHYDLVVNTGFMSVEACADVVVAAYRAKFGAVA